MTSLKKKSFINGNYKEDDIISLMEGVEGGFGRLTPQYYQCCVCSGCGNVGGCVNDNVLKNLAWMEHIY